MKKYLVLLLAAWAILFTNDLRAQVKGLLVEKYYIAGYTDTQELGEYPLLKQGSVTYRIYLSLEDGFRLVKIFGDAHRPFEIKSTQPFFNHEENGQSFGYLIRDTHLDRNVVALDSWLTIGLATRNHFGIPKELDTDGSLDRIRTNRVLAAPQPQGTKSLAETDGLVPRAGNITFGHFGIIDIATGEDPGTIFSFYRDTIFSSTTFFLQEGSLNGITGSDPDNHVLIAQLTTSGEISFRTNALLKNRQGELFTIFGTDTLIDAAKNQRYSSRMTYPVIKRVGCMNPNFLQYDPKAEYDDGTRCKDPIVFGCLDQAACNYSKSANYNIPELCCYDSQCALDLNVVCPGIIYGCMDPLALNYNPHANKTSFKDRCCYIAGCMDNRFLEFNPRACFNDSDACKTIIIRGCMDKLACNYNPFANRNENCIYNGCKEKNAEVQSKVVNIELFPNPAAELTNLVIDAPGNNATTIEVWDFLGKLKFSSGIIEFFNHHSETINLGSFKKGIYLVRVQIDGNINVLRLAKF